jgi:hypothetical protein
MAQQTIITAEGLPPIEFKPNTSGGTDIYAGGGRFFTINPAGGHWELAELTHLPEGTGLEIGPDGYPVIHQE